MQTFFLKSLIHTVVTAERNERQASIHQQQMKRNCTEGVPREGWIWRSHCQLGCLVSLKIYVLTLTGFYAFLVYFVRCSSNSRNVIILWRLKPELKFSSYFSFGWGHSDHFKYPNGTKAVSPSLSGRHSNPSFFTLCKRLLLLHQIHKSSLWFGGFQHICRISAFRIFCFEIFYCTK